MVAAAILNYQQVLFWDIGNQHMVNINMQTKFCANRSKIDRDTPFSVFQDGGRRDLEFCRKYNLATMALVWPMSIRLPNLTQMSLLATEMAKVQNLRWRAPPP